MSTGSTQLTSGLDVVAIVLGNEFDVHLAFQAAAGNKQIGNSSREWSVQTKAYVESLSRWRSAPFALESTYDGLTGPYWR